MKRPAAEILNRTLVAAALAVAASACSGVPSGVIPPKKMARLMADIHLAEAVVEQRRSDFPNDSVKQVFKESVYRKHSVTSAEVDSSFLWYGRNLEKYVEVYTMTAEILQTELDRSKELAANDGRILEVRSFQAEGDSVDIWSGIRSRAFAPNMSTDRITYEVRSDHNWEEGDIYTLRFKTLNTSRPVLASVSADYPDGTTRYATLTTREDGWQQLTLCLDTDKKASSVYASISAPADDTTIVSLDPVPVLIDSLSLVRQRSDATGIQRRQQYLFHHK
ncbi:MAG: DUF4296 domain-containing protein [Clostridium sp.]|nr:DUF4296 domain-containing protein [Clostridium sp.]